MRGLKPTSSKIVHDGQSSELPVKIELIFDKPTLDT
jgi:hypothetical protein